MKLLMISGDRMLAAGKRGAFSEMLDEFSKHFERIDIICPRPTSSSAPAVPSNVFLHPSPGGLWYQPFWIRKKGLELAKNQHFDVMTVHEYPPFYNGIGARMLKKKLRIPAMLEIHHIVGWPVAANVSEIIGRILSRLFLPSHANRFESVRTVNGVVKDALAGWGVSPEKMKIVPSFYLDHAAIASSKNQPKKYDIVFCSRLTDNKGLLETIDAVANVPDATLLIIGDGPLRAKARQRVQSAEITGRVTFTGWLPTHAGVLAAVASGRIFVMNSRSEGGPRSALEAMALGLPVIATAVGVMPDVIEDGANGIFTNGRPNDLAWKIQELLQNPERQMSIGKKAAEITHRFERSALIKAYADAVKSLAR